MINFPEGNIKSYGRNDPLQNPRPVYWSHLREEILAARWGLFLSRLFGLKSTDQRWIEAVRRNLKENQEL